MVILENSDNKTGIYFCDITVLMLNLLIPWISFCTVSHVRISQIPRLPSTGKQHNRSCCIGYYINLDTRWPGQGRRTGLADNVSEMAEGS
jgi:hypothetical protein